MDEFRTDKMTMAALLELRGFTHQRMEKIGRKAMWVFDRTDSLLEVVDEYQAGECEVNPDEFVVALDDAREALYAFMKLGRYANS